eukprot:1152683-Pelagomonas_calceolata.AAC.5
MPEDEGHEWGCVAGVGPDKAEGERTGTAGTASEPAMPLTWCNLCLLKYTQDLQQLGQAQHAQELKVHWGSIGSQALRTMQSRT